MQARPSQRLEDRTTCTYARPMIEDRGAAAALKGRLADVYVPALVDGALAALSRRLGSRARIDDPLFGRASSLSSIEDLLAKTAARFESMKATYRHIASTTGVDRDVSEGLVVTTTSAGTSELPIVVVAHRRRLREIDLRVYYANLPGERTSRSPRLETRDEVLIPFLVAEVLDALKTGDRERVLAAFEETSRFVDARGNIHTKRDGAMAAFVSALHPRTALVPITAADDGRTCCVEVVVDRPLQESEPAALSFERGDSGLLRELRLYCEP